VAEGGGLLNRYTGQNLYPGFESLPHRQFNITRRGFRLRQGFGAALYRRPQATTRLAKISISRGSLRSIFGPPPVQSPSTSR
jgi:hypothetical protein